MAYIIAEPCIDVMDKACVEVCPVDCIYEPDATICRKMNVSTCSIFTRRVHRLRSL